MNVVKLTFLMSVSEDIEDAALAYELAGQERVVVELNEYQRDTLWELVIDLTTERDANTPLFSSEGILEAIKLKDELGITEDIVMQGRIVRSKLAQIRDRLARALR